MVAQRPWEWPANDKSNLRPSKQEDAHAQYGKDNQDPEVKSLRDQR